MVAGQQSRPAVTDRLWTNDDPPACPPPIPVPAPLRACPPARSLPVHPPIRTRGGTTRSAEVQPFRRAAPPVTPRAPPARARPPVRGPRCELPAPHPRLGSRFLPPPATR